MLKIAVVVGGGGCDAVAVAIRDAAAGAGVAIIVAVGGLDAPVRDATAGAGRFLAATSFGEATSPAPIYCTCLQSICGTTKIPFFSLYALLYAALGIWCGVSFLFYGCCLSIYVILKFSYSYIGFAEAKLAPNK